MNGEFKEWSDKALLVMKESEKARKESEKDNKKEHRQIMDKITKLCGSLRRTQIIMLIFMAITLIIIFWEISEYIWK